MGFFAGIDNCRFKRQVTPGDTLRLEVEITRLRGTIVKAKALATVDGEIACETEITFALGPVVSKNGTKFANSLEFSYNDQYSVTA